jgi:hypothetical protein
MALGAAPTKTLLQAWLTIIAAAFTISCSSTWVLGADAAPASKPAMFVLSSFEEGGPDFVKGDGQVLAEHATDGKNACKLTSDKTGFHKIYVDDRTALAQVKNYHWLKADLFNPNDAPVAYGIKASDANGKFEKVGLAAPGKSTLVLDLTAMSRAKGAGELDTAKISQISVYLSPDPRERSLFFDNVRLEGTPGEKAPDFVLFDFEKESDLAAWKALDSSAPGSKEPLAKMEWSTAGATSGEHAMKITFDGGLFPTITTASVPEADWAAFASLKADVTVGRACVVGIRVRSEKGGMDKTEFLQPGKNTIATLLKPAWEKTPPPLGGKVIGFDIYMYAPHVGESIVVDNIRLSTEHDVPHDDNFMVWPDNKPAFKVLGTDMTVTGVDELAVKLKDKWTRQESKTLPQVEAAFKSRYDEFKKDHPTAVLAIFRDGQKGFDPKNPDKVYNGWRDAHVNGHGPDSNLQGRAANAGKADATELFMRHRSRVMQVDLASIPRGSNILAAQMILMCNRELATTQLAPGQHADTVAKSTMWVAEACNRPWDENTVNAYQYADGKFWKAISGTYYGPDPDFFPLFVAHGPAQGAVSWWDFTDAVKYWTSGKNDNHGFFWHGTSEDYISSPTRKAATVAARPAMMVIYEPKE